MPSTTPGTTSGISSSVLTAPRPAKRRRRDREARRHRERKPDQGRGDPDLEGEEEAADEALVVEHGAEPAQRVALGRKRGDLLTEEGEPSDEHERQQDEAERQRCGGPEREAADTGGGVGPRAAREGHCLAVGGDGVHGQFSRFLWKRPALHDHG